QRVFQNLSHFALLLAISALAVILARWLSRDAWRAEIVPLVLFGLTVAIAYGRELALLLTFAVTGVVAIVTGKSVAPFLVLLAVIATAIMLLGNIRSRLRLIQICLETGVVAVILGLGMAALEGQ